jgi:hypothetical protein
MSLTSSQIKACYFSGFANKDVAFFHAASKTLIEADLLFNLPGNEQVYFNALFDILRINYKAIRCLSIQSLNRRQNCQSSEASIRSEVSTSVLSRRKLKTSSESSLLQYIAYYVDFA